MRIERKKAKTCKYSEEAIQELAAKMSERYYTYSEMLHIAEPLGITGTPEMLLSILSSHGFMVSEDIRSPAGLQTKYYRTTPKDKTVYKVVTEEDYKKYDEEAHENAKRRLLATISY